MSHKGHFVHFHRPDGSKIAVHRDWVYMIRPPLKTEDGNCVLIISALAQQVAETMDEAERLLEPPLP